MGVKLGTLDISAFKLGSSDVTAAYIGDTLVYSGGTTPPTPPTFQGKWLATYSDSHTESADCDASSAVTENEITNANLVAVELGSCVTTIDDYGFYMYDSLTSVTIPASVTYIGYEAFFLCTGLTSVTIYATTPPTLGNDMVFLGTNDCPIYTPSGSVSDYQSAWSTYASRIQAIPTPTPPAPTLQWITFSNGDTIPSDLQIYGIKGIVNDLSRVFYGDGDDGIYVEPDKGKYNVYIGGFTTVCYNEYGIISNTSVEYIFSNIGCSDSYTVSSRTIANMSNDIQLYIYA